MKKQHDLYVNNLVGDIKANPRDFYRYINSQKKDTQGIPPLKRRNGSGLAELELEQAEEYRLISRNQADFAKSTFFTKSAYKNNFSGRRHNFFFQNHSIYVYIGV